MPVSAGASLPRCEAAGVPRLPSLVLVAVLLVVVSGAAATSLFADSPFSWNYGPYLGEQSGWWVQKYPHCHAPDQAPINITTANVVPSPKNRSLVLETVDGVAISAMDVALSYDLPYNMIRLEVWPCQLKMRIYWEDEGPDVDQEPYILHHITLRIPGEHNIDGNAPAGELRYYFQTSQYNSTAAQAGMADIEKISPSDALVLVSLLKSIGDNLLPLDGVLPFFASLLDKGKVGVAQVPLYVPSFSKGLYHYKGRHSSPPCGPNVHYFIGAETLGVPEGLLSAFSSLQPTYLPLREAKPLMGRTVEKVWFKKNNVDVRFSDAVLPIPYVLQPDALTFEGLHRRYAVYMAASLCGLLVLAIVWLLVERVTYSVPYYLSWGDPWSRREVFGLPVQYNALSGEPKVVPQQVR